jgi:hypothetical protein
MNRIIRSNKKHAIIDLCPRGSIPPGHLRVIEGFKKTSPLGLDSFDLDPKGQNQNNHDND